jgi:uncharacterized alpha-E superfamily protein
MLSRVAESIYWMSRYVERAENVARFVDVNLNLMLDAPDVESQQWEPLVLISGDDELFAEHYPEGATHKNVIQFLTFDSNNPNSILSCLRSARENARSVREIISSEMWLQLNTFYLMVQAAATSGKGFESPNEFFSEVKLASHLFTGITDATMTHGEGWHFCRMGRKLERADKTSRILDVKYFILLRSASEVGTPIDEVQWVAVLRSASAFEMYRKRHGRISLRSIVDFLLLDKDFPRSIHFCLTCARESLHCISGTPIGTYRMPAEKLLGQLCSDLAYANIDDVMNGGLHEYLDTLQTDMNLASDGIYEQFLSRTMPVAKSSTKERVH